MIILAIALSGCVASLAEWNSDYLTSGYDFREYTERGFLFTPETYTESYDAIGLVEITFIPNIRRTQQQNPPRLEGYRLIEFGSDVYYVELPDTERLIEEMFEVASDMGADALTRFSIDGETLNNNGFQVSTIKVSGLAIKRLSE